MDMSMDFLKELIMCDNYRVNPVFENKTIKAAMVPKQMAFISQPMKGLDNETIRKNRREAVKHLQSKGYFILDSIFDFNDNNLKHKELFYLGMSLGLIAEKADVVYFMKGWEEARGCQHEYRCCVSYGVPILFEQ